MHYPSLPQDSEERDELRRRVTTTIFVPSSPIRLRDQLRGREKPYARTLETLSIPGRTAFIYGERGVGKSSLALTAASEFNHSDQEPIRVVCHPAITFGRLVSQIAKRMHDQLGEGGNTKTITEIGLKASLLTIMKRIESTTDAPINSIDVNDAVELLEGLLPRDKTIQRVVIVDELDEIKDPGFRSDVAFFIKQLGDHQARLKFIFAGIATNVSDLIVHHESAQRCMETIHLEQLPLNVLRDILVEGFKQMGMSIKDTTAYRVAMLSDGFAHFTHLIGLKMALAALNEDEMPDNADGVTLLEDAIHAAVTSSEPIVREAYDAAVQKYASYEPALWAVADHWQLYRSTREIYKSYRRICADLQKKGEHVEIVDKPKLTKMLYNLKQSTHGRALVSDRRSWFKIRISMLRGYARMVAAAKGINVGLDYLDTRLMPELKAENDDDGSIDVEIEADD
ncbi:MULTISPECIES: ATP-binding protein [Sorangium]|uniref:ATP-binding protein n=1 Tax=Sorangium TaxID=39643 RepID=UPI003D9C4FA5